jgi:hypothetical protein
MPYLGKFWAKIKKKYLFLLIKRIERTAQSSHATVLYERQVDIREMGANELRLGALVGGRGENLWSMDGKVSELGG